MKVKGLRIHFVLFTVLLLLGLLLLAFNRGYAAWYSASGFRFFQWLRCSLLHQISLSFGDLLYSFFFLFSLYFIYRSSKFRFWRSKEASLRLLISILNFGLFNAIWLYLLWGSLYQQPKLSHRLSLHANEIMNKAHLFQFNQLLIQRLNYLAPHIDSFSLEATSDNCALLYLQSGVQFPIRVKKSLWGESLAYLGIEGYFNPISGEAQINPNLPHFMLPFVVAHEMAHQCGIAAEDDANLMAYIKCVESGNRTFQYSAYFNIWLYTRRQCYQLDSNAASSLQAMLNPISLNHLSLLKARNKKYHTWLDDWSGYLFDLFLRLENQQGGITSYSGVVLWAWLWERKQIQTNH